MPWWPNVHLLGLHFWAGLGFECRSHYRELIQSNFLNSLHTGTAMIRWQRGKKERELRALSHFESLSHHIKEAVAGHSDAKWRSRPAFSEEFCFWQLKFLFDLRNLNLTMFGWTARRERLKKYINQATISIVYMWNQLLEGSCHRAGHYEIRESWGTNESLPMNTEWYNSSSKCYFFPKVGLEMKIMVPVIKVLQPLDLPDKYYRLLK